MTCQNVIKHYKNKIFINRSYRYMYIDTNTTKLFFIKKILIKKIYLRFGKKSLCSMMSISSEKIDFYDYFCPCLKANNLRLCFRRAT